MFFFFVQRQAQCNRCATTFGGFETMALRGTVATHADLQRVRQSLLNKSALRNLATGDAHPNSVSSGEGRDENHVQVIFKSKIFIDELPEIEEEAIITGCPDLAVSLDEI